MTNKEREENDEIIAKFMGLHYDSARRKLWQPTINVTPTDFYNFICEQMTDETWYVDELKFYESWDWLMPVAKKIYDISKKEISDPSFKLDSTNCYGSVRYKKFADVLFISPEQNIETYYNHVVAFIKWYNETQSNKQ